MKCATTLCLISIGLLLAFQPIFGSNATQPDPDALVDNGENSITVDFPAVSSDDKPVTEDPLLPEVGNLNNEISHDIDTGVKPSEISSEVTAVDVDPVPSSEKPAVVAKDVIKTYDMFYSEGVKAYLDENWEICIKNMNAALEDYKFYRSVQVGCRLKCVQEESQVSLVPNTLPTMQFFEKLVKQTHCLLKCKKNLLKDRAEIVDQQVNRDFENLVPYDYLQLCYFKLNDLQNAASAAYTFLIQNREHEVMKENLRFYLTLPSVEENAVVNLETKPYIEAYIRGAQAYREEDYSRCLGYMESSLENYLESEEECRALCEGPFDQGWFPDFVSSVANHFTFTLRCKLRCPSKLKNVNGQVYDDLMASHYHYLQFAYFQNGDTRRACEAAASYLLFFPNDSTMLSNKDFYLQQEGVDATWFQARPEAVKYFERQQAEQNLLSYIERNFQFDEEDLSEPVTVAPQESNDA